MDIKEVFSAEPIGIEALLREPGRCFYVPVYQRPYSWDNTHIDRLISDICHGVDQLTTSADAITFLGTIITIHDITHATVEPKVISQLPPKVMTVIDGQQRLTTFLLLIAALHDELTTRWPKVKKLADTKPELSWLSTAIQETFLILAKMLEDDRDFGERRFYPRMIRAIQDQWSRDAVNAHYTSPIGEFIASYGTHLRSEPEKSFVPEGDSGIKARFSRLRRLLRESVARPAIDDDEILFPDLGKLLSSAQLGASLFLGDLPKEVRDLLAEQPDATRSAVEVFRLLTFGRYFLKRVAVTVVIGKSEEYAFDMFEALNTTGEPLTAVETFKPRVIRAEGHHRYEGSESRKLMSDVEAFLDRFDTAPTRQSATAELLIPFALAETGSRLSKRLSEQRRFLITRYDELSDLQARREFVRQLAYGATVMNQAWRPESTSASVLAPFADSEARLCLAVLRAANHQIVLAPLARFFGLYRAGEINEDQVRTALRTMTAFFALWRGAFGGTQNIDTTYRQLMSVGNSSAQVRPFARRPHLETFDKAWRLDAAALQRYFKAVLEDKGIARRGAWSSKASETPVYSHSKPLTRFLLLAATHDTVPDPEAPGLAMRGTNGVLPLLSYDRWTEDGTLSIEHVAPQTRSSEWESDLYADDELVHRLGNLVLIPVGENAGLSNLGWATKRASYQVMSATSPDAAGKAKEAAVSAGIQIPSAILNGGTYRPVAAAVAQFDSNWNVDIITRRSLRLAELAWDRLAPWLGLPG